MFIIPGYHTGLMLALKGTLPPPHTHSRSHIRAPTCSPPKGLQLEAIQDQ